MAERNQLNLLSDELTLEPFPEPHQLRSSASLPAAAFEQDDFQRDASAVFGKRPELSYHSSIAPGAFGVGSKHFPAGSSLFPIDESHPRKELRSDLTLPSLASASSFSLSPRPSLNRAPSDASSLSSPSLSGATTPSSGGRGCIDEDLQRMLDNAPCDVVIVDDDMPQCSEGEVPELPVDYERANSVSCRTDVDTLYSNLSDTMMQLRCDFELKPPSQISGCAYYHAKPVDFRLNIFRNPTSFDSLTVEVHRINGCPSVFTRFFDDVVGRLGEANLLCKCPTQYPTGQCTSRSTEPALPSSGDDIDMMSVEGSSVTSSERLLPSSSGMNAFSRAAAARTEEQRLDIADLPMPPRPAFASLSRGASTPPPAIALSGAPPRPRLSASRAFSTFESPRRPTVDLRLAKGCMDNLLEPFRSASTLEEQGASSTRSTTTSWHFSRTTIVSGLRFRCFQRRPTVVAATSHTHRSWSRQASRRR